MLLEKVTIAPIVAAAVVVELNVVLTNDMTSELMETKIHSAAPILVTMTTPETF